MQIVVKDFKYHRGADAEGKEDVRVLKSGETALIISDTIKAVLAQQAISCKVECKED